MSRERLVRRIEMEARAYINAKGSSRDAMILGRIYGLLEAGTIEGYWRKRDADSAGELVANRYRVSRIRDVLLRGDKVAPWRVADVASFLGVSEQRVDQLQRQGRFPSPIALRRGCGYGSAGRSSSGRSGIGGDRGGGGRAARLLKAEQRGAGPEVQHEVSGTDPAPRHAPSFGLDRGGPRSRPTHSAEPR